MAVFGAGVRLLDWTKPLNISSAVLCHARSFHGELLSQWQPEGVGPTVGPASDVQAQTIANFLETVTLGRSRFTELGPFFASLNRYKHSPNDSSRHGMLLPGIVK